MLAVNVIGGAYQSISDLQKRATGNGPVARPGNQSLEIRGHQFPVTSLRFWRPKAWRTDSLSIRLKRARWTAGFGLDLTTAVGDVGVVARLWRTRTIASMRPRIASAGTMRASAARAGSSPSVGTAPPFPDARSGGGSSAV